MRPKLNREPGQSSRAQQRSMVEEVESRILFHFTVIQPVTDFSVAVGTPTSTIDLSTVINSDEIPGSLVRFQTTNGTIDLALFDAQKPITVANFLSYVNSDAYNNTIFHRSTDQGDTGLTVIQGGGFNASNLDAHIPTGAQIVNEFLTNGIKSNTRGTIAMAKTSDPNSATSEYFINVTDNSTALDNQSNSGGFTVFGQVVNNTIGAVDEIEQLPKGNFNTILNSGSFAQLPVRNYSQTDFQNNVAPGANNLVIVNDASVIQKISYTVTSSDPALVNPTITGDALTLNYGSGEGAATITVTGTGVDGSVATDTFSVGIGTLDVTIGEGGAKGVTYTDADGTVGTLTLKGGTAVVRLNGTSLTQTTGLKGAVVTGAVPSISSITLTGTNSASTFTVKAKGGDGALEINDITATGGLKALAGKPLSVNGAVNLGSAGKVDLADITNGSITIGGSTPTTLTIGAADDSDITSAAPVKSIKLARFAGEDGVAQTLTAPSLGKLTVTSDFAGNLSVSGALGSAKVGGGATAGTWTGGTFGKITITGDLGSDLTATSIASLKAGTITNADIRATSTIGKVTSAGITGSSIFANVTGTTLPADLSALGAGGSIAGVTNKGAFTNSNIAALVLGKLSLGTITTSNGASVFGVAGDTIATVSGTDVAGSGIKLSKLTTIDQTFTRGDFIVRVL